MLWHRKHFAVGKPARIRPVIIVGLAEDHRDLLPLVHFRGAWEQRPECVQLGHDAPQGKYVDRVVVAAGTEDVFWRSVPPSRDILSKGSGMADFFDQAEIAQLDDSFLLDQDVLRFNVSMEKAMAVDII